MQPLRFRPAPLYAAAGLAPALLAFALPAVSRHAASSQTASSQTASSQTVSSQTVSPPQTPQQVADTLDSIIQPRFQRNAGRFGVDRVLLGGHDTTYGLAAENAEEQRKFQQVNAARRPYMIAFLHCAHKPGQYVHSQTRGADDPVPYVQMLAAETATEDGIGRLWGWGDTHLDGVATPELAALRRGTGVNKDDGNWRVVLRPVRAEHPACLSCHAGAKPGDTLGVMVYAVDKNTISLPLKSSMVGPQ